MKYFLLTLLLLVLTPTAAFAQNAPGITVSPSLIRLDLSVDQPETKITYANTTSQTFEIDLSAANFTELEDGYKVSFLEGKDAENYKYGLSSWISFNKTSFILAPKQKEEILVSISKDKLSPGGHYGSILAKITSSAQEKELPIQGTLVSLLFVRTNTGVEKELLKLQRLVPQQTFFSFPNEFVLRLNNSGDTDTIPYGRIDIYDFLGRSVGSGILNEGSLVTLPETIRKYDIPIKKSTLLLLPGVYKAQLSLHYGKKDKKIESEVSFFSYGSIYVFLPILAIIGLLVFLYIHKNKRSTQG